MICSIYDLLIPMCVHVHRYAFVVFVSEGIFSEFSNLGQLALSVRCGFISITYAILHAHFIYRYFALYKWNILEKNFVPYGLIGTFVYCFCHMVSWAMVCEFFFYEDDERKTYVYNSFHDLYSENAYKMSMVIALYWEGSRQVVIGSWIGVSIVTISSIYSMGLYFLLGHKILKKLRAHKEISLSVKTLNVQRQLFNALTVQTVIPICVSLLPCLAVWFGPVFLMDLRWVYLSAVAAVSIFPCIDPIAVICFLPSLRERFLTRAIAVSIGPSSPSFPVL